MGHLHRDAVIEKPVKRPPLQDAIVEVHLWDVFLKTSYTELPQYFCQHSFDKGPLVFGEMPPGRVCYRFTQSTWTDHIEKSVIDKRIPVTIKVRRG